LLSAQRKFEINNNALLLEKRYQPGWTRVKALDALFAQAT
jgi:hypothetical protein